MSNQNFRFKQFEVNQDKCAMKVNTDGVLLGAWADVAEAKNILDIGTGTGVIALMMAQKNANAIIDAIDIDNAATLQAHDNFKHNKWSSRLSAIHYSLQNFNADKKYDVIISNPPYFIDDQKSGNVQKDVARHSTELSYAELLEGINRLLSDTGKVFVVIPSFNLSVLELFAEKESLFVTEIMEVTATTGKSPYVVLLRLERERVEEKVKINITIQTGDGVFTDAYKALTEDFYLKF